MIQLSTVLQQIEKELQQAQQSSDEMIIYQKLAAIKALCELTEQPNKPNVAMQTQQSSMISSQEMMMMTGQLPQEELPVQDNLFDF